MNKKVNSQTILIVLLVCVTVFISTNTFVNAQMGGNDATLVENAPQSEIMLDPVPGGPGFIMVSAFDFIPYNEISLLGYAGTGVYNPSNTFSSYSVAGLTLPHGATITKVTLYYYDNVGPNIRLRLGRGGAEGVGEGLTTINTEGAQETNRSVSQTNIVYPIVDNQNYSYYLDLNLPHSVSTNILVLNVRIDYEYPGYLPCVQK